MKSYQRIFDKPREDSPTVNSNENIIIPQPQKIESETMNSTKNQLETVILAGINFSGDIKGAHDIFLNGIIEGTVSLNSRLFVGQTGKFKGQVEAENIIIEGEVDGTMTASERIEIREGGKCIGDVFSPSVMISDKAFFEGRVSMNKAKSHAEEKAETKELTSEEPPLDSENAQVKKGIKKPPRVKIVDVNGKPEVETEVENANVHQ